MCIFVNFSYILTDLFRMLLLTEYFLLIYRCGYSLMAVSFVRWSASWFLGRIWNIYIVQWQNVAAHCKNSTNLRLFLISSPQATWIAWDGEWITAYEYKHKVAHLYTSTPSCYLRYSYTIKYANYEWLSAPNLGELTLMR